MTDTMLAMIAFDAFTDAIGDEMSWTLLDRDERQAWAAAARAVVNAINESDEDFYDDSEPGSLFDGPDAEDDDA